jgi:hypothetical protein
LVGEPGIGDKPTFTGFRASVDNGALYFFKGVDVALRRTGLSTLDKRAVSDDASAVVRFGVNGAGLAVVVLRGVLYAEFVLLVVAIVEFKLSSSTVGNLLERVRSHGRELITKQILPIAP